MSADESGRSFRNPWRCGRIGDSIRLRIFLFSNGKMTDLGTFGLDPVGEAINNHGVIVGQSGNGAFVWSAGSFQALNNLIPAGSGFTLNDATAINDNGQIVANGYNAIGQTHAFLLTPSGRPEEPSRATTVAVGVPR
jgi:probable HAF family extracellular repeat protein